MFSRSATSVGLALFSTLALAGCALRSPSGDVSPDGRQVVFPYGRWLARIGVDGSGYQLLPNTEGAVEPRWSPDGRRILIGTNDLLEIYDLESETARRTDETPGFILSEDDGDGAFAWSRDGKQFVETVELVPDPARPGPRAAPHHAWLYWLNADPLRVERRMKLSVDKVQQVLWLDEERLVFLGGSESAPDAYLVRGGSVQRLTRTGDLVAVAAAGGGQHIVWARMSPADGRGRLSLFDEDLGSGEVRHLPSPRTSVVPVDQAATYAALGGWPSPPRFSPDGTRLACVVFGRAREQACVARIGDETLKRLPHAYVAISSSGKTDRGAVFQPVWSPDGKRLVVFKIGYRPAVRVYDADGRGGDKVSLPPEPPATDDP